MNITISPLEYNAEIIPSLSDRFGKIEEIYADKTIDAILFKEGLYYPEDSEIEEIFNHIFENKNDFEWNEEAIDEEAEGGIYFRLLQPSEIDTFLNRGMGLAIA